MLMLVIVSFSDTFALESDKVIYGLVYPIRTFEILRVQVSAVSVSRLHPSIHPSEYKHPLQSMRRELMFLSLAEWPFCNHNIITSV